MVVFIFLNDGPIYSKTEVEAGDALRRGHFVIDRSSTARLQFLSWIQSRYSHHLVQISPLLAKKKSRWQQQKCQTQSFRTECCHGASIHYLS